ncbi:MAG: hypothetical protein ACRDVP_04885 [Acidimicrobiales bacterium]
MRHAPDLARAIGHRSDRDRARRGARVHVTRPGRSGASAIDWALSIGAALVVVVWMAGAGRRAQGPLRSSLFASSAGVVLGVQAALLKATIARFMAGAGAGFSSWELWAMIAAALSALVLIQSAYESGALASTMPLVDAIEPSVAIVLGLVLFQEHVRGGSFLAAIAVSLALLLAGIVLLDTSPVIRCLGWKEREARGKLAPFESTPAWQAPSRPRAQSVIEATVLSAPRSSLGSPREGVPARSPSIAESRSVAATRRCARALARSSGHERSAAPGGADHPNGVTPPHPGPGQPGGIDLDTARLRAIPTSPRKVVTS